MKNVKIVCMILGLILAFIPACVAVIITTSVLYIKKEIEDTSQQLND